MPGTMTQADLVADLKASLHDAADVFTAASDADFVRHLNAAAAAMNLVRPRTLLGTIALVADKINYAAPTNFAGFKAPVWGTARPQPWEKTWPGKLPAAREVFGASGLELHLVPAPTAQQIATLGSDYKFYYYAAHAIGAQAADTTIKPADRGLLLLRAQAEAMKEMAMRNIGKPVSMRDGLTNGPRNGTPSHLFEVLMDLFDTESA